MSDPTNATAPVTADPGPAQGDQVTVVNALGEHKGVIARVRELFDETGARLRAFEVAIKGLAEPMLVPLEALVREHSGSAPAEATTPADTTAPSGPTAPADAAATPGSATAPATSDPAAGEPAESPTAAEGEPDSGKQAG